MAFTEAQKASIITTYIKTESVVVTYRWVQTTMHKTPPSRNTILPWQTPFLVDGNMEHIGGNRKLRVSYQNVEDARLLLEKNPHLSI